MGNAKNIPVRIAINPHMAESVKGYAQMRDLGFAKAFNQFYEFGDRLMRLYVEHANQVRPMVGPDGMARSATPEDAAKIDAFDIMRQILSIKWSNHHYETVYFPPPLYARLKAKAESDGMTITNYIAMRAYCGLGAWDMREKLKSEIRRVLDDPGALRNRNVQIETTRNQSKLNFLNEQIFSLADAQQQDTYERAKRRFLAEVKKMASDTNREKGSSTNS